MMPAGTPMGEAVSGSRLDRLAKTQGIIRQLCERGMTQRQIGRQLGASPALLTALAPSVEQWAALRELVRVTAAERLTW